MVEKFYGEDLRILKIDVQNYRITGRLSRGMGREFCTEETTEEGSVGVLRVGLVIE